MVRGLVIAGVAMVMVMVIAVGAAQAAQYDFQDGQIADWTYTCTGTCTVEIDAQPYDDTYVLSIPSVQSTKTVYLTPNIHVQTNYLAFTTVTCGLGTVDGLYIQFYDVDGNALSTSPNLRNTVSDTLTHRIELIRDGANFYIYKDGVYTSLNYNPGGTAYNFAFKFYEHLGQANDMYFDDVVAGGSQPDIIGTAGATFFYILNDYDDPTNNGLYDASGIVYTDRFHTTYGVNTQVDQVDEIEIRTFHVGTGYIVNTTTIDTSTDPAGLVEYDLDELFFDDDDAPFGYYIQRMYDTSDSAILDTVTMFYLSGNADIDFDSAQYYYGDVATITWDIATNGTWDTATYTYTGQIIDVYNTLIDEWSITTATGSHTDQITETDYDDGTIYCTLWAEEKATGDEFLIGYDGAEVSEAVVVSGTTYNAESGAALGTVSVIFSQGDTDYTDTSTAGGAYEVTDLAVNTATWVNATKAGYTHENFTWTPLASQQYTMDLYLIPDPPTHTNTSVNGIVYDTAYHQAIESATVTIENLTWSDTTTTSATGYYIFNSLYNGTYTVSTAAVPGFSGSSEYEVTTLAENVTQQDIEMDGIYTLTVECRDRTDEALISDTVLVELSNGETASTSAGSCTFTNLSYGLYDISASTDEMSGTEEGVLVDENETATVYLSSNTGGGSGIAYPPHNVKFIVETLWGEPLAGVTVTATYVETSGPLDWIFEWLGISEDIDIEDTTLQGTTGTDGAIDFMMVEVVQYHVTAVLSGVCDEEFDVYPKDEYYKITVGGLDFGEWFTDDYNIAEVINISVDSDELTSTTAYINVSYADTLAGTSNLNIYINQTNSTGYETVIDSWSSAAPGYETYHNFTIADQRGESYFVHVTADHSTFTGGIDWGAGVTFRPGPVTFGIPEELLVWVAMFLIFFTMLMGTQTSTGPVAIMVCFEGWIFWSLRWLDDLGVAGPVALTFATVVAVMYNIMLRSKRREWS